MYNEKTLQRLISLENTNVGINKRLLAEAGFEYKGIRINIYTLVNNILICSFF
jgi:hypothetical protein